MSIGRPARIVLACLLVAAAMLMASQPAVGDPMGVGKPVAVSGPDPEKVGTCTKLVREEEVSLAADPLSDRLVAAWIQRVSGANTILTAASDDRGRTWSRTGVPGVTRCTGTAQQAENAGDPTVSIGTKGRTYLTSFGNYGIANNDIQGNWCCDSLGNWSNVAVVDGHTVPANDFPQVVADRTLDEHAYIVWIDGAEGIRLARTEDGGRNWATDALPIAPSSFAQLVVLPGNPCQVPGSLQNPDGFLANCQMVLVFAVTGTAAAPDTTPTRVFTRRSTDGGVTWSPPLQLAELPGKTVPRAATGPGDTIYISWWNAGNVEIMRSTDGGQNWSATQTTPDASRALQGPGPVVAVDRAGTVGVLWYDSRPDPDPTTPPTPTEVWFSHSHDRGENWSPSERIAGAFDFDAVGPGIENGPFKLGEYFGLVPFSDGFGAAFPLGKPLPGANYVLAPSLPPPLPENSQDIFYSHIFNPAADLSLDKTAPATAQRGTQLTYTVSVQDNGPSDATGVVLKDELPKQAGFLSATTSQGSCTPTKIDVRCELGSLASGKTATVKIVVRPTQQGTLLNTASVSASEPADPDTSNNTDTESTTVLP